VPGCRGAAGRLRSERFAALRQPPGHDASATCHREVRGARLSWEQGGISASVLKQGLNLEVRSAADAVDLSQRWRRINMRPCRLPAPPWPGIAKVDGALDNYAPRSFGVTAVTPR
jgi:hypothetical protein